jgi:dTMP kinase
MHPALKEHNLPGKFVVICGMDGAGKTTVVEALDRHISNSGFDVLVTRQPTNEVRKHPLFERYIYQPESRGSIDYRAVVCLLSSDRLQHVHEVIKPALARGCVVICDRYIFSALAELRARGFGDQSWFLELCSQFPRPDLVFLLRAPLDILIARIRARSDSKASFVEYDHMRKLHGEFDKVAAEFGMRIIDTSLSPDRTISEVIRLLPGPLS